MLNEIYGENGWSLNVGTESDPFAQEEKVFAEISVWNKDTNSFITRKDYGEDAAHSIKALASDAIKRAGFRFGIGQALYTGPKRIFVSRERVNWIPGSDKTPPYCNDDFVVDEITYTEDDKRIKTLVISDLSVNKPHGEVVFAWDAETEETETTKRLSAFHDMKDKLPSPTRESNPAAPEKTVRKTTSSTTPATITKKIDKVESVNAVSAPIIKVPEDSKETASTVKPVVPKPMMGLERPTISGPEGALNTLANCGNKKGAPLKDHRPVELAFLFGDENTSEDVKSAIKQIAAATPAVKDACIKRGYGSIVA